MNVSVGPLWERYVESAIAEGRYASASDIVRDGLRLVEERDEKQRSLRETIQASIARGGSHSVEEVRRHLKRDLDAWEQEQA